MEFRMVGDHPEDLHDGRQVAFGDFFDLTKEDLREDLIEDLIAAGKIVPNGSAAEKEHDLAAKRASAREDRVEEQQQESEAATSDLEEDQ
jgi:hypothetical protein